MFLHKYLHLLRLFSASIFPLITWGQLVAAAACIFHLKKTKIFSPYKYYCSTKMVLTCYVCVHWLVHLPVRVSFIGIPFNNVYFLNVLFVCIVWMPQLPSFALLPSLALLPFWFLRLLGILCQIRLLSCFAKRHDFVPSSAAFPTGLGCITGGRRNPAKPVI